LTVGDSNRTSGDFLSRRGESRTGNALINLTKVSKTWRKTYGIDAVFSLLMYGDNICDGQSLAVSKTL
jgi:hypothetical protein